jgi:chromosome segregation ATPase
MQDRGPELKAKEAQLAELEKEVAYLKSCLDNSKEQLHSRDIEAELCALRIFKLEEQLGESSRREAREKALVEENKLLQAGSQELTSVIKELERQKK